MDDNQRRDEGTAQRRKVLGNAWVDKSAASKNAFNADFLDLITRYAWGEIWTRPHFDERTRRVLVIGTMVALGQWDEFRLHVRAALTEGGFTPDDIKEMRYGILRHRIIRTFDAVADNVSIEGLIDAVFKAVPVP